MISTFASLKRPIKCFCQLAMIQAPLTSTLSTIPKTSLLLLILLPRSIQPFALRHSLRLNRTLYILQGLTISWLLGTYRILRNQSLAMFSTCSRLISARKLSITTCPLSIRCLASLCTATLSSFWLGLVMV